MKNEFKRMQFLAGIITENNLYEGEPSIDFSGLSQIDDLIDNELSKAEKEQPVTEIVGLTTAAFILAIPGIINGIFRIIKSDQGFPYLRICQHHLNLSDHLKVLPSIPFSNKLKHTSSSPSNFSTRSP